MTATQVKPIRIGPYTAGEVPPPFTYQFFKADGVTPVQDLSAFTVKFNLGATADTGVARSGSVTDGPNAKVTYNWAEGDIPTAGDYVAQFWAYNTTTVYASRPLIFTASAPVTPVPDI